MSRPPFMHSNFFSSLKQVEKRLKLDSSSSTNEPTSVPLIPPSQISPVQPSSSSHTQGFTMTDSLSCPIYLINPDQQTKPSSSTLEDSELPREFLSVSHKFSKTQDDSFLQPQSSQNQPDILDEPEDIDDIQLLMQLLHLPNHKEETTKSQKPKDFVSEVNSGCKDYKDRCCDGEFYAKVVGMKGPQCETEVERLESWIIHFENGGGENTSEPLRLAHLLLAKAASISEDENGISELEFPSTIQDFLLNDPPRNCEKT